MDWNLLGDLPGVLRNVIARTRNADRIVDRPAASPARRSGSRHSSLCEVIDARPASEARRAGGAVGKTHGTAQLDLDIGVIYTNDDHYLTPLVQSMAGSGDGLAMRLILVDNDSTSGVEAWTRIVRANQSHQEHRAVGLCRQSESHSGRQRRAVRAVVEHRHVLSARAQTLTKMTQFMDQQSDSAG